MIGQKPLPPDNIEIIVFASISVYFMNRMTFKVAATPVKKEFCVKQCFYDKKNF